MAKKPSRQRLARVIAKLEKLIEKALPPHLREKWKRVSHKHRAKRNDPCAAEQVAYDAAIAEAAQKLIEWEDAEDEATAAQGAYQSAFTAALIAALTLDHCRNPL